MKKLFIILWLLPCLVRGQIIESDRIEVILPHVTEETWVLFDLDNTLIESSLHLGSIQWESHLKKHSLKLGYNEHEIGTILEKFWTFVQHFIPVRLVDPQAPNVLKQLDDSNATVFGLTARAPNEVDYTRRQLDSVNISLCTEPSYPEQFPLLASEPILYDRGVIYCGDNTKSEALIAFFNAIGRLPKKVVFIDDKFEHVRDLERTLEQMGINFIGIRFSRADERVQSFDSEVANLQFSQLPQIISDEEAKLFLMRNNTTP
jgi:FMN phosphatase YigB (HAD superfamily)